ncbi:MAG: sulfurtransferase [Thaumarchaeota archaeon]|nr:sulfurtransferase [Nitrososphaerota archaeon]
MRSLSRVTVSLQELQVMLEKREIKIVDGRERKAYDKGHIPQAISISIQETIQTENQDRLAELFASHGVSRNDTIVVYDDTFGAYAARIAWNLAYLGYGNASVLDATFSMYRDLGYDVSTDDSSLPPQEAKPEVKEDVLATIDYVENFVSEHKGHLLDVRERLNYLESHIPGATSVPWRTFSNTMKIFQDPERVEQILTGRGISKDDEIITYCGGAGTLSSLAFYGLLLAGYEKVRLYAKSFIEWKSLGRPVDSVKDANYWDLSAD